MHIDIDDSLGYVTLTAITPEELADIKIVSQLAAGEYLKYGGTGTHHTDNSDQPKRTIKLELTRSHIITFFGTTPEDNKNINYLRYMLYCTGRLEIIEFREPEGIVASPARCKICNNSTTSSGGCEWKICDQCAQLCDHQYEKGIIHSNTIDIGVGWFCQKCGRGKPLPPEQEKLTLKEHHQLVAEEFNIPVVYKSDLR